MTTTQHIGSNETIPVSIRLSREVLAQLDGYAKQEDRSRNYLINKMVERSLAMRKAWDDGIEKAIAEVESGASFSMEEVFAEMES